MADMSDPQFAALLQMEDLGGMEKKLAQQQAVSNALRSQALQPSAGKDWASQMSRGLQGGMAGYAAKQYGAGADALGGAKKANLSKALSLFGGKPAAPPAMPNVMPQQLSSEDLTGF